MKRACLLAVVAFVASASLADEKPTPDRGEAIAKVSVPGMQCEGTCPPTVKAALQDGPGMKSVSIDYPHKLATIRFDADATRASDAVARLAKLKPYAASSVVSVEAVFDGDYAHATASADTKRRGHAKVKLALEPKAGHLFNAAKGAPDLEVELASVPAGLKAREPLVKVKGGLKAPHAFDLDLEIESKARAGETAVTVEVRLVDEKDGAATPRVVALVVPILIP